MRILMNKWVGGAWGFITESLINALNDKGHIVKRYDGLESSWQRFDPDLYIGCSGHRQHIPNKRRAMVAIHVNPYGPVNIQGINESEDAISWVLSQKPDVVFGYGSQNEEIFWSYWQTRHDIPWVPMPTAGDKKIFADLKLERDLDIVYLGGRWAYKAQTIDRYLFPVIHKLNCRKIIRGWGGWPEDMKVEKIDDHDVNYFLNRGFVGPCISEKHTQQYGIDIPERAFKLALCGVCVIHDPVPSIKHLIPSAVVAKDENDYYELVKYYVENPCDAQRIAESQKIAVLQGNTYHHRCAALFRRLGMITEADHMCT